MAQPWPQVTSPEPRDLRLLGPRRELDAQQQRLRRGLLVTALAGSVALGYLCLLVRASIVDAECHRLEVRREELRTIIAADMTKLGSLTDQATNLNRAERYGLQPVRASERIFARPELCRAAREDAGEASASDITRLPFAADIASH